MGGIEGNVAVADSSNLGAARTIRNQKALSLKGERMMLPPPWLIAAIWGGT